MSDDVKTLRDSIAMLAGEIPQNLDTLIASDIIIRRCLADSIEREEAELTFTHEQINERDRVIADEAWNAAIEAAIKEFPTHYNDKMEALFASRYRGYIAALRRGAS